MKQFRRLFITAFCFALTSSAAAASTLSTLATVVLTCSNYMLCSEGVAYDSFRKTFGGVNNEEGHGIFPLSGNRAVVIGFTETYGAGGKDVLLDIYNTTSSDLLLSKAIGGTGDEVGYRVVDTHDGGFMFVGDTNTGGAGGKDALAVKVNEAVDTIEWGYALGDTGDETGRSVKRDTSDDGFIVAGFGDSYGTYNDGLLLKLSSLGALEWTTALTGVHEDVFYDVAIDSEGNYRVVGATQTYALEHDDALVTAFNKTGSLIIAYAVFAFETSAHGIAMADDDSFGVVGCIFNEESGYVEFFMNFDPLYTLIHAKAFGVGNIDCSALVVKTPTGYGITGSTPRTGGQNCQQSLTEFNENGDMEWSKVIGESTDEDSGKALTIDADGNFLVTGVIAENHGDGDHNLFFDKYKADGGADCGPNSSPPMAVLDLSLSFDLENNLIEPTTTSPTLTVTDIKAQFSITDIVSPVESLICSVEA